MLDLLAVRRHVVRVVWARRRALLPCPRCPLLACPRRALLPCSRRFVVARRCRMWAFVVVIVVVVVV